MDKQTFLQRFHLQQTTCYEDDYPLTGSGRQASVLIPVLDTNPLRLLLTVRASHLRHHPGQISFPGGAVDDNDASLKAAAIRECHEEINLTSEHTSVIGQLPAFRTISGYRVTPFVGVVSRDAHLQADPDEVDEIFTVPLDYALNPDNHHVLWVESHNARRPVYFIPWQDKMIWGATAALTRNLSHIIYRR